MPPPWNTSITIVAPAAGTACSPLTPQVTGVLWDTDNGVGVVGETVYLYWNGQPVTPVAFAVTGAGGAYTIPPCYIPVNGFGNPPVSVNLTLTIYFLGGPVFLASNNTSAITITYCEVEAELASKFFVTRYRTPSRIDDDAWGAVLCIDPNSLRADQKGPHYYLLDTCTIRPGLTDKAGGFRATINDNKTSIDSLGNQKRIYDMTLFEADTFYIRDNDEFWIGVQQGTVGSSGQVMDNSTGRENSWADGVGGRYWFLGGWISKRFYQYTDRKRITATIEGKDYMDLWKENFFGTDDKPRDYTDAETIDILQVVVDILADMNTAQEDDYEFRSHPSLFPGSPLTADVSSGDTIIPVQDTEQFEAAALPTSGFIFDCEHRAGEPDLSPTAPYVTITGVTPGVSVTIGGGGIINPFGYTVAENAWIVMTADLTGTAFLKEFNNNPCFRSMQDLSERADFEWKISPYPAGTTPAGRRRLEFYSRLLAPVAVGAANIFYHDSIRDLPSIMVGNTTNLVTNALVTGKPVTLPEPTGTWTNTAVWLAKSDRPELYSTSSIPSPPNSSYPPYNRASYSDVSLVLDDEGYPAINFQKDNSPLFDMYLSFYAQGSDIAVATLDMDLRKWKRLKLRFRHATAASGTIYVIVQNYLNLAGATIVVTATSVADEAIPRTEYLVEGIDWFAAVSNNATAASIQAALNALTWVSATVIPPGGAAVTATGNAGGLLSFLSFMATDADPADLAINTNSTNIYRIALHTYNLSWKSSEEIFNQKFFYTFGTGTKQSSHVFNDPVLSNHDIVTARLWSKIDIQVPDVNPDGSIGNGTLADLYNDTYMHGWRPVFLDPVATGLPNSPETTADPTNIDFISLYVSPIERGPGGTPSDAPGQETRNLGGGGPGNKNFVHALSLASPATAGKKFINVTNAQRMAGDWAFGPTATEARSFNYPYPRYVLWGGSALWEEIKVAGVAGPGSLYPTGDNVYLAAPLDNSYPAGHVLLRGGWNISFGRLHFTPGAVNIDGAVAPHLANPKRFRLISSDDVEYSQDVEGLADQTLLDAASLQAVKFTLDGDPRRRIGTRVIPWLDPQRFSDGKPTTFHAISTIIETAEHHIMDVDFYSVLLVSPLGTRARERLLAMVQGNQEAKSKRTNYGGRIRGKYVTK